MMKSNKAKKTRCVMHAARSVVEIFEKRGLRCVLTGFIAAFLHGSQTVPEDVSLVVLGGSTVDILSELLQKEDPIHFKDVLQAGQRNILRYHDTIDARQFNMDNSCRIRLTVINDPTHIYHHDIQRLRNLPVVPFFPILIDHLQTFLNQHDQVGHSAPSSSGLLHSSVRYRLIQNLLETTMGERPSPPPLASFNHEAILVLEHASRLLPQLSDLLVPLIHVFRQAEPGPASDTSNDSEDSSDPNNSPDTESDNESDLDYSSEDATVEPHTRTIYCIAKKVVKILSNLNINSALFGSAACSLYGNSRSPNDVDILAFPPPWMSREQVKQAIETSSRKFFRLERSANPDADYKVLYYQFGVMKDCRGFFSGNKCKIDVLLPGILHLPTIPQTHITKLNGLPVVPFSLLLLQKLQAWDDRLQLRWTAPRKYARAATDARDLKYLLTLDDHVAPLKVSRPWDDPVLFSQEFQDLSKRRVRDFCKHFPEVQHDFQSLGLLST